MELSVRKLLIITFWPDRGDLGRQLFFETFPYPCNNKTCRTYIYNQTSLFCSYPPHFCIFPYIKNPRCSLSLPGCLEWEFKVPISMTGDGHGHSMQRNWSEFRSLPVSEGWWSGRKDFGSTENTFRVFLYKRTSKYCMYLWKNTCNIFNILPISIVYPSQSMYIYIYL